MLHKHLNNNYERRIRSRFKVHMDKWNKMGQKELSNLLWVPLHILSHLATYYLFMITKTKERYSLNGKQYMTVFIPNMR